jgi:Protein of unknown function (DUF4242)
MVYVVERYLPGLSRTDLLRGLSKLEQATEARAVRYLGSTIVLEDEACFCQFEGPSEAAVAEANCTAGLSFDRIVPAVTVTPSERRPPMTVSPSIPATVEMRPSRFAGIVILAAAVAAAITWALSTYVMSTHSDPVQASTRTPTSSELALVYSNALGAPAGTRVVQDDLALDYTNALGAPAGTRVVHTGNSYVDGITSLDRVQQAAAFGGHGAVLDALGLSPRDRQYVQGITSLTRAEQAAAFGR